MRPLSLALSLAPALAISAFTSLAQAGEKPPPPPQEEKIRVANQLPFDVAACSGEPIAVSGTPTKNMLASALVLAQPRALECLTPPESRGPAATTTVRVTVKLDAAGATWSASGDNLKPPGAVCIADVLKQALRFDPLPAGAAPLELAGEMAHDSAVNAAVQSGINAPSDWVGAARSSLPRARSCYAPWAAKRPPVLTADVHLKGGKSEISFRKAATPEADALGACVLPQLAQIGVPISDKEFRFALKLVHLHSAELAEATDLGPELAFQQADLGRLRLFADAELALAVRTRTAAGYDASIADYKKAPRVNKFQALVKQCGTLVQTDEKWLAAAKALASHEERMSTSTRALADKDPSWKAAADGMGDTHAATEREVAAATQTLATDKETCARLK